MPNMYEFTGRDLERFWAKVQRTDGCWLWTAGKLHFGHGLLRMGRRPEAAHRISYMIHFGPIPDGMQVNHHCDNPPCVRPDHIYAGTQNENVRDRTVRGRGANVLVARNRARTHCPKGHPLSGKNLLMRKNPNGRLKRSCKTCVNACIERWQRANPERNRANRARAARARYAEQKKAHA